MRPNQQNKRSRGRNNNGGRKQFNPMSRNFESNGPDVKIRGNASHIAEKYIQLARDASASGDLVMAENYFQHAEHYFRIVSAAQQQNPQRSEQQQPSYNSNTDDDDDDDADEDRESRDTRSDRDDGQREQAEVQPIGTVEAVDENAESETAEDQPAAPKRRRRARSNGTGEDGKSKSEDPGDSPQPDTSELPAFLTNGQTAAE
jgi:hypothetical protein